MQVEKEFTPIQNLVECYFSDKNEHASKDNIICLCVEIGGPVGVVIEMSIISIIKTIYLIIF